MQDAKAAAPAPKTLAEAIRRWVDENEKALNLLVGSGVLPVSAHFNTAANDGRGDYKVRIGQ